MARSKQQNLPYIYEQDGTRANTEKWWTEVHDDYDLYLRAGSAGALGRSRGLEQAGFWRRILAHPAYDDFWRAQAMDRILAGQPLSTPMLLVHSYWDAEDIYGDLAVYRALQGKPEAGERLHLVLGPWNHGQEVSEATHVGAIAWGQDTGRWFRRHVLAPYLAHYLQDDAPPLTLAPVVSFESGTDVWRDLPAWPAAPDGSAPLATRLYLQPGLKLGFQPAAGPARTADYVSDPAKPVPYRARPIQPMGYDTGQTFPDWLADDQREASGRTDVLAFTTNVLTGPRAHRRPSRGAPDRLHQRHGQRLGGQADRRLPRPVRRRPQARRLGAQHRARDLPRPLPGGPRDAPCAEAQRAPGLRCRAAGRRPRVPARPPHHGAGAVEPVSALRPQPAELRSLDLLGQARRLTCARCSGVTVAGPAESFVELPVAPSAAAGATSSDNLVAAGAKASPIRCNRPWDGREARVGGRRREP